MEGERDRERALRKIIHQTEQCSSFMVIGQDRSGKVFRRSRKSGNFELQVFIRF